MGDRQSHHDAPPPNHPHLTTLTDAQLDYELGESQRILAQHGINAKTLVFPYDDFDARVLDYTTR